MEHHRNMLNDAYEPKSRRSSVTPDGELYAICSLSDGLGLIMGVLIIILIIHKYFC